MMTININPSASCKCNDNFSFGLGFSAQYLDVTLSQKSVLAPGVSSFTETTGDSWGYGCNFGALYEFNDNTRIGASYRSSVFHSLKGDMAIRRTGTSVPVTAKIKLPASAQASVFHPINSKVDVMADVMWTDWSVFEDLTVNTPAGQNVTDENWKDNMRYSLGGTYHHSDVLAFRAGVAYDETPIPDATRTPRIPGADRTWVAFGSGYKTGNWSFEAFEPGFSAPDGFCRGLFFLGGWGGVW
ncbi:MAG: outer membrane protein transport protein [Desulfuromonadaceae bacterium]|nr:outer membrane protein transport protein [Desulfuromonadaceae bacterium]